MKSKKTKIEPNVTERSLYYWVVSGNTRLQVILVAVILLVVVARVLPLEMQKRIINDSIALRKFDNLLIYCAIYLLSVIAASGLKLIINYLQSVIGEKAIMRMRQSLYEHILTLPLSFFRRTQPGMVVSSLMTELSTAGTFAGMALAVPITNVLTLLALGSYLLWLNFKLALATLIIYPVIVMLLPWLQTRANKANVERVDLSRKVSSQITESVTGIQEVQVQGGYDRENKVFGFLTDRLRKIRVRWSLFKFGIKTTNNFFVSLGPFIVFIFGGYLVIRGQLQLGSMVAFLSAQEKLYDPWKELINFYQVYQDAQVRYKRTMEHFSATAEFLPDESSENTPEFSGGLDIRNLVFETREGVRLLRGVNFSLGAGEHMALVGFSGSGKTTLVQCIAKMYRYNAGTITIDGEDLDFMTKGDVVSNIGYISQNPFVFTGSIRENLIYADQAVNDMSAGSEGYEEPGLDRLILSLQQAGLFVDVLRFGLDSMIDDEDDQLMDRTVRIRANFRENFGQELVDYVEFYNDDKYLQYSTVADNIIFGSMIDGNIDGRRLSERATFLTFIHDEKLYKPLMELSIEICRQTLDIIEELEPGDSLADYSPVPEDRLDKVRGILVKIHNAGLSGLKEGDVQLLLEIVLKHVPGIYRIGKMSARLQQKIVASRSVIKVHIDEQFPGLISHYDQAAYIQGESIINNIFFGRIRSDLPDAQEKINQAIIHLLIEENLLEDVAQRGMEFQVGSMGDRLSGGQRQKLAIARVLLKEPRIIIMDEATSALDNKSQARIQHLVESRWRGRKTLISIVHRLDNITSFDKIGVMKAGKMMEFGPYDELMEMKGGLYELVSRNS